MKSVSTIMILFLLAAMASCGKDNKSGKGRNGYYGFNQLGYSGTYQGTGISYNGQALQQVILENPCANGAPQQYRIVQTVPAPVNSVIANGDIWVGVTSFGDVAAIGGTTQGPIMQVFACPRSQMTRVSGSPQGVTLLPYTSCGFKQMNASLSLGDAVANFRIMDYGNSAGAKFSYCR